jgi:predicted nuclease of predicted toxin-antitoxin system
MSHSREHVVLTHDLDFSAILSATHGEKPSVVQIRSDDVNPSNIEMKVIGALRQMESELNACALVPVDPNRTQLRLLPLPSKD